MGRDPAVPPQEPSPQVELREGSDRMSAEIAAGAGRESTPSPGPRIPSHRRRPGARTYTVVAVVAAVAIVLLAGYALGWFRPKSDPCSNVTLLGAGANFISPLMSAWTGPSGAFDQQTGNHVNYNAGGAGFGITAVTTKTVDFAATDDPLDNAQITALPSPVLTLPITAGALAIIYDLPGIAQPVQLSGSVLADIYLGTVTNWNDSRISAMNPGVPLPNQVIIPLYRSGAAGTTFVLTDLLSKDNATWASKVGKGIQVSFPKIPGELAQSSNTNLLNYVVKNANTIGYVDLSDVLNANWDQYAKILNPAGQYVLPTLASTTAAISQWQNVSMVNAPGTAAYPLATFAYFFVYSAIDAGHTTSLSKARVLVQWLDWTITTGQRFASGQNYVPLPASLVQLDQNAISALTFSGNAVQACAL
jgi:phosphate transport system substrate-binding protein